MSIRRFFRRSRWDDERAREIDAHLAIETDENIARGMTPDEARRAAHRKLGSVTLAREEIYRMNALGFVEACWQDLRYGARILRVSPSFAIVAIVTLALGIGAGAAVFSVVDAVLLRPLVYPNPERIVRIEETPFRFTSSGMALARAMEESRAFSGVGLYATGGLNVGGDPAAERVRAAAVSPGFFDALGVRPMLGRMFTAADVQKTRDLAVLSRALWRRRFADASVVSGRTVLLNGRPFTILGVMPARFDFPGASDVWIPVGSDRQITGQAFAPKTIARLAPGISAEQARGEVDRLNETRPGRPPDLRITPARIVPFSEELVGGIRPLILIVASAVVLVLLVTCINTANLLLARVAARARDLSIRRALGATRARLVRQLLVESLLLAALAGMVAVPAAAWTLSALRTLVPPTMHGAGDIAMNARAVGAAAALSLVTALLFGIAPCFSINGRSAADALRSAGGTTADPFWRRFRSGLVVAEIAIALVLLAGAATVVKTVARLANVDLGARGDRALTMELTLPTAKYDSRQRMWQFYDRLDAALRGLPGVEEVGATSLLPGSREVGIGIPVDVEGLPAPQREDERSASYLSATTRYFAAIGIDRVAGRVFGDADRAGAPLVAVVNERLARAVGVEPASLVGRRMKIGYGQQAAWGAIIGVVRDVRLRGPERQPGPQVYVPYAQTPTSGTTYVVVKGAGDPRTLVAPIRAATARVDQDLPLYNIRAFDEVRTTYLAERRFAMALMIAFGALAFALATIGLYGVVAYLVQLRTREIGIRMALGASPGVVRWQVLRSGLSHTLAGLAIGAGSALALMRVLAGTVPGLDRLDAASLGMLGAVIVTVAAAATWMPARRATRIDPLLTLRTE